VEATFKEELARSLKEGFTTEEVADGKKAWQDERMVARSDDDNLASMLLQRERFDRTLRWDEALEAKIAALTPADVSAAFRRHVDPAAFIYVKGGDFQKAGVSQ
jgi:zinc protease